MIGRIDCVVPENVQRCRFDNQAPVRFFTLPSSFDSFLLYYQSGYEMSQSCKLKGKTLSKVKAAEDITQANLPNTANAF